MTAVFSPRKTFSVRWESLLNLSLGLWLGLCTGEARLGLGVMLDLGILRAGVGVNIGAGVTGTG